MCERQQCKDQLAKLNESLPMVFKDSEQGQHYQYVHCEVETCHVIRLGTLAFRCYFCEKWLCFDHIKFVLATPCCQDCTFAKKNKHGN